MRSARVPTKLNISDGFTKVVDVNTIRDHRFRLHGMDLLHTTGGGDAKATLYRVPNPAAK